jgi:spore germination cell wall hydrolase CwlJ-like protein
MRKNQIILDEAARSVRRAFVGSLAGSATMLGVIGVAGAYGMPERLSAQSLSTALTSLQIKLTPMTDSAGPIVDRAKAMAASVAPKPRSIAIESDDEVILQVPPRFALASAAPAQIVELSRVRAIAAPITPPTDPASADVMAMPKKAPVAAPAEPPAAAPVVTAAPAAPVESPKTEPAKTEPAKTEQAKTEQAKTEQAKTEQAKTESPKTEPAKIESQMAEPLKTEPVMTTAALPPPPASAPSRPVRAMPGAMPAAAIEPPALPALLVFEQPQLDKIKPLEALPGIEIVETPKPMEAPRPAVPKAAPVTAAPEQPKPVASKVASKPAPEQPELVATPVAAEAPKAAETQAESPMLAMASADPNHIELPSLEDYPKVVFVHLPMPKPPMSPAQRLNLTGDEYDKAEKCLAQAIYFEARAEPVRGQQAVAQVVLNRVFSPYYPKDVCSVVYQNAHRHLSCQFTFACDGKPEAIRERGSWARANRIARQALHATVWLPEVAKATHYHATYVKPDWIRDMKLLVKHGVHIFYRPRNWGDGSREAQWATPSAEAAAAPVPTTKVAHKKGEKKS